MLLSEYFLISGVQNRNRVYPVESNEIKAIVSINLQKITPEISFENSTRVEEVLKF